MFNFVTFCYLYENMNHSTEQEIASVIKAYFEVGPIFAQSFQISESLYLIGDHISDQNRVWSKNGVGLRAFLLWKMIEYLNYSIF